MSPKSTVSFEDKIKRLESVIQELEGDIPLDKAIKVYEEGTKLCQACQQELQQVEKKILKLVDKNGEAVLEPISDDEFPDLL